MYGCIVGVYSDGSTILLRKGDYKELESIVHIYIELDNEINIKLVELTEEEFKDIDINCKVIQDKI